MARHANVKSRSVPLPLVLVLVFALIMGGLAWYWHSLQAANMPAGQPQTQEKVKPKPQPQEISSHIMVAGNSFWGRYTNDNALKNSNPYAWPFARLKEFGRDKYDA